MAHQTWSIEELKRRPLEEVLEDVADRGLVVTVPLPDGRKILLGEEGRLEPPAEDVTAEQRARNEAAIRLLDAWSNEDEAGLQEQRETWDYLRKALDEDRLSDRKLDP